MTKHPLGEMADGTVSMDMTEEQSRQTEGTPGLPAIEGLVMRTCRGEGDLPELVRVSRASQLADSVTWHYSVEKLANELAHTPGLDPSRDVLVVEVATRVVGWGLVSCRDEETGGRLYHNYTHLVPEWRGRGIMHAMQRWLEDRAARIDAGRPSGAPPSLLSVWATDSQLPRLAVLRDFGYRPVRYFLEMERDLTQPIPEPPLPEGLTVRPVRPHEHRRVFTALVEADREAWGQVKQTEADYERFIGRPMTDPSLWTVAWDGDEPAGMVLGWIDHEENGQNGRLVGYTEDIAVLPPYRRRGLARALLARNMALMRERGMTVANLGVDSENPSGATRLYEGMGFRAVRRYTVHRKPLGG